MSNKKKWLIIAGVVIVLAIFIIANLMKGKSGHIEIQVEKVKRGDITQIVSGTGRVKPEVEVKISATVSSEITGLSVKEGDGVKKGNLLVELDRKRIEAAYERARSTLKSAQASLAKAKSDYNRIMDLHKQNLISQAEKESSEASLLLAESDVDQARANVTQAADDLSKTRLYSPIDGVVTRLNKELGEIALGSTFQADVIMTVADLSKMQVVTEIDENDVVMVSLGDTTDIEVDAIPDTILKGVVSEIAHSATTRGLGTQEEVTNFEVKVNILDKIEKLRPGMSSTVDIKTERHRDILYVPIQAVTVRLPSEIENPDEGGSVKQKAKEDSSASKGKDEEQMKEVVFIVEGETAKIIPVESGISDDTNIEIISGLEEGKDVVIGSYRAISKTLKDGSLVKITKKGKVVTTPKE